MKYTTKRIGEVANIRRGSSPRPIDDWMAKTGIPWVKISDATQSDSRFIYKTDGFIREEGKYKSVEVFPEDLIISNSATPGLPRIMKIHACIHDGWLLVNDFKGVTRDYLLYQVKCLRKYLVNQGNGSIFKNLKTDILKDFPIQIPINTNGELDESAQTRIAKTLTNIEDKIENNTSIYSDLTNIEKLLYDYWFVQFDFIGTNGQPYKSSGGKMVWNNELKREIPEGWEVKKAKDVIEHINTGLNPRQNFVLNNGNIKYITVKNLTTRGTIDFTTCDTIDEDALEKVHKRSDISKGDILFASIAPLGRCVLIREDPKNNWDINESIFSIRPENKNLSEYLYLFFMSKPFIKKQNKVLPAAFLVALGFRFLKI